VGPPTCPADSAKPLATIVRFTIVGKGTLTLALAQGARCVPFGDGLAALGSEPQEFTITGGTGQFAAASGRGMREQRFTPNAPATETLTGTLEVPGRAFDVTAPRLHGIGSKNVRAEKRAKSARVTFNVTATDGVDGAVPVSCLPKSGSRFEIGRTTVRCEATDSSGNTAKAAFTVTLKSRR
jgi:hypothetical protein